MEKHCALSKGTLFDTDKDSNRQGHFLMLDSYPRTETIGINAFEAMNSQ